MAQYTVRYTENGAERIHETDSAKHAAQIATRATRTNRTATVRDNRAWKRVMSCHPHSTSLRKEPGVMFKAGAKKFAECWLAPSFKKLLKK